MNSKEIATGLRQYLRSFVLGNDEYIDAFTVSVFEYLNNPEKKPPVLLVMGAPGTGKTYLMECAKTYLAKHNISIGMESISDLTEEGVKGRNLSSVLNQQKGADILFLDEIDKVVLSPGNTDLAVDRAYTLSSQLMRVINAEDHSKRRMYVLGGSFEAIKSEEEDHESRSCGFIAPSQEDVTKKESARDRLLEAGVSPELIRRVNHIIETKALERADLEKLLYFPGKGGVLFDLQQELSAYGIKNVTMEKESASWLLDYAASQPTQGVSALKNTILEMTMGWKIQALTNGITEIVLTKPDFEKERS